MPNPNIKLINFPHRPVAMTMHQQLMSDCGEHVILRVYNGWIYSAINYDGQGFGTVMTSTFVPMHKKEKDLGSQ